MIRAGLTASAVALAVMVGTWIWLAGALPQDARDIPVHWGLDGTPDRFSGRGEAILLLGLFPAAGVLLSLLLGVLPLIDPLRENLRRGARAYLTAWIGAQAMLALATVGVAMLVLRAAGGDAADSGIVVRMIIAAAGVMFVLLGDALPKTRPNFFLGVRTPWTLSSDLAWEKTHRLAGRLVVFVGLWGVIAAFTLNGLALALSISAPLVAVALIACAHSYFVWRSDPDRRRPVQEA